MITPIFILSLPRSGSTLLQRLVATHPSVATASEPWFLLPLFLGYRDGHLFASYQQPHLVRAFRDFLEELPGGEQAHHAAVRQFAETLYERACGPQQTHFLDKTPRYHLIAEDLLTSFPNAKWIFLWRNPLAVVASCLESRDDRWKIEDHRIDLYHGLSNLMEFHRRHSDQVFSLRYEDLVEDPESYLRKIFHHLDLAPFTEAVRGYREVQLKGQMGDKKGDRAFSEVSTQSRDRWVESFANLPRRLWARRYLTWIGRERLALAGYELEQLKEQLSSRPLGWRRTIPDVLRMGYARYRVACEPQLFRRKRALAKQGIRVDVPSW